MCANENRLLKERRSSRDFVIYVFILLSRFSNLDAAGAWAPLIDYIVIFNKPRLCCRPKSLWSSLRAEQVDSIKGPNLTV